MKILLDECLPVDFRYSFPCHEAHTVQWAGLKGKKNGELLYAAEVAGFEVLITVGSIKEYLGNGILAASFRLSFSVPYQPDGRSVATRASDPGTLIDPN